MHPLVRRLAVLAFLFSSALSFVPAAEAWGCKGHQTVALIAERHLTTEARELVQKLLTENPIDPGLRRNCGNPVLDLFADSSTWADDVSSEAKNGSWHYINIPRGASRGVLEQFCGPGGCVVQAVAYQLAILKDRNADPRKRADALRYLAHFVGDLHMPLHATTNSDQGGNCVPVRYLRRRPHENNNSFAPNLHASWDVAILERDMEGGDPLEYADFLEHSFASEIPKWQAAGIHVEDWTWQSHDLAEKFAYGQLAPKVPVETPAPVHSCSDADNIGQRMMQLHLYAGPAYQDSAAPVIRKQIESAGVRLAMILNDVAESSPPEN